METATQPGVASPAIIFCTLRQFSELHEALDSAPASAEYGIKVNWIRRLGLDPELFWYSGAQIVVGGMG